MNLIARENEYSLQGTKVDIIYICVTGSIFISAFPNVPMKILRLNMIFRTNEHYSLLPFHFLPLGK